MQLLMSQYSGLKDVVVQTAMAGRVASELEPLIGWFANGAAVRTKLDGKHSLSQRCPACNRDGRGPLDTIKPS